MTFFKKDANQKWVKSQRQTFRILSVIVGRLSNTMMWSVRQAESDVENQMSLWNEQN